MKSSKASSVSGSGGKAVKEKQAARRILNRKKKFTNPQWAAKHDLKGQTDKFGRAVKRCCLCKHTSKEDSPLVTASPLDKNMGLWPWLMFSIKKIMYEGLLRDVNQPTGSICGICTNVTRIVGDHPSNLSTLLSFLCF